MTEAAKGLRGRPFGGRSDRVITQNLRTDEALHGQLLDFRECPSWHLGCISFIYYLCVAIYIKNYLTWIFRTWGSAINTCYFNCLVSVVAVSYIYYSSIYAILLQIIIYRGINSRI